MTQKETLQYNKRCAKFLGAEIQDVLERIYIDKMKDDELLFHNISVTLQTYEWNGTTNIHYIPFDMLSFHSDWNWIMEVKNHIIGLGYCWFQFPDTIQINENFTISSKSICKVRFDKLQEKEAVVEAINQFLIWYEQQNK